MEHTRRKLTAFFTNRREKKVPRRVTSSYSSTTRDDLAPAPPQSDYDRKLRFAVTEPAITYLFQYGRF